jgi:predicted PurR-regulated permease PerM
MRIMNNSDDARKTIIFTVILLFGLGFLYYIRDILFQILISFVIVSAFKPFIKRMEKHQISRTLSVVIAYVLFLSVVGFSVYILVPSFVYQTGNFVKNIPAYLSNLGLPQAFKEQILQQFLLQLGQIPGQIGKATISIFSNVLNVVTVLIISFYLLISREKLDDAILKILGETRGERAILLLGKIEDKIGGWAKAELLLMIIVGSSTYLGLLLLKVPYALPLAIIAGLLEIVPMIGPFIAAVPAIVIGFGTSLFTGIATASLAFLIQQVENYIFVPKIMQKSVGLNPVITLLALSIGFKIQGIAGALISIPIILSLSVLLNEVLSKESRKAD